MTTFPEEVVAEVCHEANRVLQGHLGDLISPPWHKLDQETRESAIDGVRNARSGATPEESHENWMRFKVDHGWEWGEIKDPDDKTHPLLVPYDELPEEQRSKDAVFTSIVRALSD